MSGYKYSSYRLARERAQRMELLQTIRTDHAAVEGLQQRVGELLQETSAGLQETFAAETEQARRWLEQLELPELRRLNMRSDLGLLRQVRSTLAGTAARGREAQRALRQAYTQKADELGQRLAGLLAELEGAYAGRRELLGFWYAGDVLAALAGQLQEASRLLEGERYGELEALLENVQVELEQRAAWAEGEEEKHQKRLYLLQALRQVCADMGFVEVSAPRFEEEGQRGSRILLTVDTVDRGQIAFTLSLEGISSFSEIADDHCFEEFGQISEYLEQEFGIQTQFHTQDGEPIPRLLRKGELDLPEDAGMEMAAGR
ncbi:MAG: hypothetical protein JXA37_03960 [Chloroflexia bacterium]|nr:hypothetical protein [Chloroflexia bacterium]